MNNAVKSFIKIILILFFISQLPSSAFGFSKEDEAFLVAQKAFDDGFYEVGIGLFERFLEKYPENQNANQARIFIGECYFYQQNYIRALEYFQSLLDLASVKDVKDTILYWIAEIHFKEKRFAKAQEFYQKLIQDYPKSIYLPFVYYALGLSYFGQNNFETAQKLFSEFNEKFPKHQLYQDSSFKIGECLYSLKKYSETLDYFSSFIKEFSSIKKIDQAHFYQAESYFYKEDYANAINLYQDLIKETQEESLLNIAKLGLAWSYLKIKKYELSLDMFNQIDDALLEKQITSSFFIGRATALMQLGNLAEAIDNYEEAIDASLNQKDKITAFLGKAQAQYDFKKYNESITTYKFILNNYISLLETNDLEKIHYNLALCYLKINQKTQAITEFQKTIDLSKDSKLKLDCFLQIGYIYESDNDYENAKNIYKYILEKLPKDLSGLDDAQFKLINILIQQKSFDSALFEIENFKNNFSKSKFLNEMGYFISFIDFQKENYINAKQNLQNFIKQFPVSINIIQAKYLLGLCFYNLNLYKEAVDLFTQTRQDSLDQNLIQNLDYRIAQCFDKLGNREEALKRFKDFSVRYPNSEFNPNVLYWLAQFYYKEKKFSLARRYYRDIIQNYYKSDLFDWARLGIIYLDLEENFQAQATDQLWELVKDAKDPKIKVEVNIILARLEEDPAKALNLYKEALRLSNEQNPDILFNIAESCQMQSKTEEALENYAKVINTSGDNSLITKSLLRMAQIFEDKQDWKKAQEIYLQISGMSCEEAEFAKERLDWIETNINKKEN